MQINDIQALINRGEQFVAQRQFEKGFDCFLRASELNPSSTAAWCGLGQCQKSLHRVDEARQSLERALSLDPTLVPALYNLANLLFDCGKYEKARGYFEQTVAQQPHSWMILDGLGRTFGKLGCFDEALERFNSATQQAPGGAVLWGNRGWALMNLNRLEEAMRSLERAVALDQKCDFAWLNLGVVQRRLGLSDVAAKTLERATMLFPDDKWPWIERGKCLESLGHHQKAISCFRKATQVSPQFGPVWMELGWTYLESGQPEEAVQAFHTCLNLDPQMRAAHIGLGHALTRLDRVEDAMKSYAVGFSFEGSGGPGIHASVLWRTGKVVQNDLALVPLAYLVHQMTFRLSQLSRREFGVSLIELPHTYFVQYADIKDKGGQQGMRMAKYLPQIRWILGAQRSAEWAALRVESETVPKEPPMYLDLSFFRVSFHETIGHCFEAPMYNWLMDIGENIRDVDDLFQSTPAEGVAQRNIYSLASTACSEGFSLWLQFYGERAFSEQRTSRAIHWEPERQRFAELSETNPYRIGLDVFEAIEKYMGELCAVAAYFVAFDLPRRLDLTTLSPDEAKVPFRQSINNPNFRLQVLVGMPIPWDFRRNDGKRFIALAKPHIAQCCKKTPQCTISGHPA